MKKIIPLALMLLVAVSCKKKVSEPKNTTEFSIQSTVNSATYDIKIALPADYDPQKKYATIYVLDANENFALVTDQCKELSQKYSKENVLVISIGYGKDRALDYTPTKTAEGGGEAPEFMAFIKNELIPRVEQEVAADTNRSGRMILGHSFGGLFAAYAFTRHNEVFGNYLMLSPSVWFDDEVILQYEQDHRETIKTRDQLVFLGIGQMENAGRMQAPFEALYQVLIKNYPGAKLLKNSVPQLDHMGSKNPNIEEGLDFYFHNK